MCEPVSIAAAALAVAGTVASAKGAEAAQNARNSAVTGEQGQQAGFAQQGADAYGNVSKTFDPASQQALQDKYAANRQGTITSAMTPTPSPSEGMNSSAPRIVADTAKAYSDKSRGLAAGEGNALGRMASFGDLMTGNNIALQRSGEDISKIASFSQGTANLLPLQLQLANTKGQGLRSLGGLLSSAGSAAGMYGAMGKGPSWGSLFGSGAPPIGPATVANYPAGG